MDDSRCGMVYGRQFGRTTWELLAVRCGEECEEELTGWQYGWGSKTVQKEIESRTDGLCR